MPKRESSSWDRRHVWPPKCQLPSLLVAGLILVATVGFGGLAAAESPVEVAEELSLDGVFIAQPRDGLDEPAMRQAVERARARGLRLVAVAPRDPQPDPTSFARRVLEAVNADAAVVFTPDGEIEAFMIEDFESAQFRALTAARSKTNGATALDAFTEELLTEPTRQIPKIINQLVLIVLALAIALAVVVIVENQAFTRRAKTQRASLRR